MTEYRKSSHSIYDLKYHIVWITKYRKTVLKGDVAVRAREIIRQVCKENDVEIVKGNVLPDHIHMLLSIPPHLSVSGIARKIKGRSAHKLLAEFKHLSKIFWGKHFWARGYFAVTIGAMNEETIKKYIENQEVESEKENEEFKITDK